MEVLPNDAFNPGAYNNHIPTEQIAKNENFATTLLLIGLAVTVRTLIYLAAEKAKKEASRS